MNNVKYINTAMLMNRVSEQRLVDFLDNCGEDPRELMLVRESRVVAIFDASNDDRLLLSAQFADDDSAIDAFSRVFEHLDFMQEQVDDADDEDDYEEEDESDDTFADDDLDDVYEEMSDTQDDWRVV